MAKTSSSATTPCPVCDHDDWESVREAMDFSYKGTDFTLNDFRYSVCKHCGYDVVFEPDSSANEARIRDEHRRIDGMLTSKEIRRIRKFFKLTQQEAGRIFGGGGNAFSKYERGLVTQSVAMDRLLRLVFEKPDAFSIIRGFSSIRNVEVVHGISLTSAEVSQEVMVSPEPEFMRTTHEGVRRDFGEVIFEYPDREAA